MPCLAPSEFLTTDFTRLVGAAAETFIEADYLKDVGRVSFFPVSTMDFADFSHGFGNTPLYVAFLKTNNPSLSVSQLLAISGFGDLKIPDIMTHDVAKRTEFYEIKPNSGDGRFAGTTKVALIAASLVSGGLPHIPGVQYSPNKKIKFFSGLIIGHRVEMFFHFVRILPGLIVYEFCIEGDLAGLALDLLLVILAAGVVALFLPLVAGSGGGVLVLA
jgi:hypothetical protein